MTKKLIYMASAGLLAAMLAACGNVVTPVDPFPDEERTEVTASSARGEAAITGGTASGVNGQLIEVSIPQEVTEQDVVWFELANAVNVDRLVLYDSIAGMEHEAYVSTETGWFDNPENLGDTPPAAVDTSQIVVTPNCAGPCIIHATDENVGLVRYVRVVPEAGMDATFDFHVYGDMFDDEIMGLTKDSAINIEGDAQTGHIIFSEMERWYKIAGPANSVTLTQDLNVGGEEMAFKAQVYVANGLTPVATLTEANATHTFDAPTDDVWVNVSSFNDTRASAPGYDSFTVGYE